MNDMGFLDSIEGAVAGQGGTQAQVASGLMQTLQEHPEGVQGLLSSLQSGGVGDAAKQWASGAVQNATPDQVQAGLGNSGLLDTIAAKAGVSPQEAQSALTTVLPMVMAHVAPGGQPAATGDLGSLAGSLMQKFL
jgi:uncharacterized protein YidB (DUF937 family)